MSTADDRDGRKSKRSSHRRRRTPSPESDSYDSYTSESSPERAPRRSKTAPVGVDSSRGYNSDDGSYRSSRRTDEKSSRRSTRDRDQTTGTVSRTRVDRTRGGDAYAERSDRDRDDRRRSRRDRERNRDDSSSRSTSPQKKKSLVDDIMASFGLAGKESSSRSGGSRDDRDRRGTSRRHDRDDGNNDGERQEQKAQALKAAITAAALEAWRTRKNKTLTPTERMMRIASAAVAAGGLDVMIDRNPDSHGLRHIAEAVVGGLVTSKTVGGNIERKDGFRNKIMDTVIGRSTAGAHSMYAKRSNGPGSGHPRHKESSSSRRARSR